MSFTPRIEHLGATDLQKIEMDDRVRETTSSPKDPFQQGRRRGCRLTRRTWVIILLVSLICLLAIIAGVAYHVWKSNRYPNYTKLNYALKDEFKGPAFFDNFDFFSQTDPANGKVMYVSP